MHQWLYLIWYRILNNCRKNAFLIFLRVNGLLGPFIITNVNIKKRTTITHSASHSLGSCPFARVIAFPLEPTCYSDNLI